MLQNKLKLGLGFPVKPVVRDHLDKRSISDERPL